MNRSTAPTLFRPRHLLATGLGFMLGQAVMAMAQRGDNPSFGFVTAAVLIGSAAASFVLFVLGRQAPMPAPALKRQAQVLVALIGVGLLFSLRALDLVG